MAKRFLPLDRFDGAIRGQYRLLPFRILRLDASSRYVLTNEAGQHLVLPRSDLDAFVRKQLPPTSPIYIELKSRHFLLDADSDVALDLLALKVRTRAQRIAQFTALHIFVVTLRCDYTCQYCQVSRQNDDSGGFDMAVEDADRAIDFMFKSPSPALKVEFQGGESLLNFPLIRHIVDRCEQINKAMRRDLAFVIATNLSPLTAEILDFCRQHRIAISTSLDGPADLHNKNRPRPGRNGHTLTVEGIERARAALGEQYVSALMTTTPASLGRVREIVDAYLELDFDGIFLRPLSPYGFAVKTGLAHRYDVDRWLAFYKEGLDYILDLNRQGTRFVEQYTQLLLRRIFTPFGTGYVDLQSPAGIGISGIVYNYDGTVYASDEARMLAEMGDFTFRLGNLRTDSFEQVMLSDALLDPLEQSLAESSPMCSECGLLPYCGSDPVYHHATQRDAVGHKAFSGFCAKNMGILKHIFLKLEDDLEAKDIMMGWL